MFQAEKRPVQGRREGSVSEVQLGCDLCWKPSLAPLCTELAVPPLCPRSCDVRSLDTLLEKSTWRGDVEKPHGEGGAHRGQKERRNPSNALVPAEPSPPGPFQGARHIRPPS
ncbi:uncharacterized protein LOC106992921 isoform X3 [Macaca mulatta]